MMPDLPPVLLHGSDYNPEQWLHRPDILEADIDMMGRAGLNCVTLGVFSWAALEPEEGRYELGWLAGIIDRLYQNDIYTILATPGGARPAWLAQKYPEVLRVDANGQRRHFGGRHNHCPTSPVYRQKTAAINTLLARELAPHPGVILWHINNEYSGECFCPLCQSAFRDWLREKYGTLQAMNHAWWTSFWSHTYTSWAQVEPPFTNGEAELQGLMLDWRRFTTRQTVDFCAAEKAALRAAGSDLPVTTNMMEFYPGLDYRAFRDVIDIASWDSYPCWTGEAEHDMEQAARTACFHDLMRCLKKQPFLLMESTPSSVNWRKTSRLKRPGGHMLEGMLALAHGANSVQYFQWRKSRGGFEKFHGAVVGHDGREDTRVFADVAEMGKRLKALAGLRATLPRAKVALVYDWENLWALENTSGPRNAGLDYEQTVLAHYAALWRLGIAVDVIAPGDNLTNYALVSAPLLYMQSEATAAWLTQYVQNGGTLVAGCLHGLVDETDLCHPGDAPTGQTRLFGLRVEETDALEDGEANSINWQGKTYTTHSLCDLLHTVTAKVEAAFDRDFYAGRPAFTQNQFGKGWAWYIATQPEQAFYNDLYIMLADRLALPTALDAHLPHTVVAAARGGLVFVLNFSTESATIQLRRPYKNAETGEACGTSATILGRETLLLREVNP